MPAIQLGEKLIKSPGEDVYIIAEIGQNHQGSMEVAKEMITEAKRAGSDCVKFQMSILNAKFTKAALNRSYEVENSWGTTYGEHKKHLEFTAEQFQELQRFANDAKIDFTASAMDEESLVLLDKMDVPFIKIGSGDANNLPMLLKAAKLSRALVISTGMQVMETLERIVEIMADAGKSNYALLHCVSAYPTQPNDCSLKMIPLLMNRFPNVVIGYSGHEMGTDITQAAVLLGARIVERHFTLDRTQKGSDHNCSLEPKELQQLTEDIRAKQAQGLLVAEHTDQDIVTCFKDQDSVRLAMKEISGKYILPCELSCRLKLGKSVVASRKLHCGQRLSAADLCVKVSEPNGIAADAYETIVGARLKKDIDEDEPITINDITFEIPTE